MKKLIILVTLLILSFGCTKKLKTEISDLKVQITELKTMTRNDIEKHVSTWPEESKTAVNAMLDKSGLPEGYTTGMVVWKNTAPFKRTIVYKEETLNLFPERHSDVIEQAIDFNVPKEKVLALWEFDGSIIIDKVRGELLARNQSEEMNTLALNLAVEVAGGKLTSEQARKEFSNIWENFKRGNSSQHITNLNFVQTSNSGNPDISIPVVKMQAQQAAPAGEKLNKEIKTE
jgi:hypothetical protein